MNLGDLLNYSIIFIKRNPKSLFLLLINIICFFSFVVSITISSTYYRTIKSIYNYNNLVNMVSVDLSNNKNKDEVIEKLKQINHVSDIIHQKYFDMTPGINNDSNASIWLYPLTKNTHLHSYSYSKLLEQDEIVIPENYYPYPYDETNIDLKNYKIVDGKSLIGKTITIKYSVFDYKKNKTIETKNLDLKVVGTYNQNYGGYSMGDCFVSISTLMFLDKNSKINLSENQITDKYYLQVDKNSNINNVRKELKRQGFVSEGAPVEVNNDNYNIFVYGILSISFASLLFCIFIKSLFIKKNINDNRKNLILNKIIGFENNDLISIELINYYIVDFISVFIVVILSIFLLNYYNTHMQSFIILGLIPKIPYISIILMFLSTSFVEFLLCKHFIKKYVYMEGKMLNVLSFYRKKNTYIYIMIFITISLFLLFLKKQIVLLNINRIEYDNYIVIRKDDINKIDKSIILYQEECMFFYDTILSVNDSLSNDEIILSYNISDDNSYVISNNLKIVDYSKQTFVNLYNFEKLKRENEELYLKIYLTKIEYYEKYKKLIDDAVFYNETLNIQKTSKSLHLFNILFRIIVVVLIFMIIVAFFNLIFDNRKNNQLLKFLGYSKSNIFLVMMCNFFSMIVISLIIYILGWMLL